MKTIYYWCFIKNSDIYRAWSTTILHVPKFFTVQSGNFRLISRSTTYQLNIEAWPFTVKFFWSQWHRPEITLIIHTGMHSISYSYILGILKGQYLSCSITENMKLQSPRSKSLWQHKLPYIHCHCIPTSHRGQLMRMQSMWTSEPRKMWYSLFSEKPVKQTRSDGSLHQEFDESKWKQVWENFVDNCTNFSRDLFSTACLGKTIGLSFMLHWFKKLEHMTVPLKSYSRGCISYV